MPDLEKEIEKRRTFAIISHPDAGKTTLTEKFLLYGGAINLAGSVKGKATARHAVSDWMEIAETNEMPVGIYVTRVIVDSPAYEAGLKAGDIIVASGENDLTTTQKLQSFLENYSTGDVITIQAYRSGQDEYVEMEFEVTLGAR